MSDRALWNARAGYIGDSWEVFSYAKNLFDKDYINQGTVDGTRVRVGDPLTIGMIGKYYFN